MATHPDLRRRRTASIAGVGLALVSLLTALSRPARAELTFEVVKSFDWETSPRSLALGRDGALYGTTAWEVFKIDSAGTYTSLSSLSGLELVSLVVGSDGILYGFTHRSVSQIDSAGALALLHSFSDEEGSPIDSQILGSSGRRAIALFPGGDGALYGITRGGGSPGTIFRIHGGSFTSLHSFSDEEGTPADLLVPTSDGTLYGVTAGNGSSGLGTVFRIDSAGTFTTLHSFSGADGVGPSPDLVLANDGALYGTTAGGGSSGFGTVFRIDSAGSFTSLHSFLRDDFELCSGSGPTSSNDLILGKDGTLYGVHTHGSDVYYGEGGCTASRTLFRIDSTGIFTPLHSFDFGSVGWPPVAGVDGALYWISTFPITVFRIDKSGTFTPLHSFGNDEFYPSALIAGPDGALYGTTFASSSGNRGTLFRIDAAGTFTSLHSFSNEEGSPSALIAGPDGVLYGIASGSESNLGTIFRIDGAGTFTPLHSFSRAAGGVPEIPLAFGSDGAVYGITLGLRRPDPVFPLVEIALPPTVYKIDSGGTFTSLHSFGGPLEGVHPTAPLALGSDGALYGTTYAGGSSRAGTVFKLDGAGGFTSLHSFTWADGYEPDSALVLGSDGALYGTTYGGGVSWLPAYHGAIFKIDSAGIFHSVHVFRGHDGRQPSWPPVLGSDGALYGTTLFGGQSNCGTVYRVDRAGRFTSLHSFSGWDGCLPVARLVLGSDGAVYGTTGGTFFRIDSAGTLTTLHRFGGSGSPIAQLLLGNDGALYGTTFTSVFRIDNAGSFTTLHSFSEGERQPAAPLAMGSDGAFYGTTTQGGSSGFGTIFRIDSAGTYTSLHSFDGADGSWPTSALVLGIDDALYGTTDNGGSKNQGTVFRIDSAGTFTSLHSFSHPDMTGPNGLGDLVLGSDGALYGTAPKGGRSGGGVVYRIREQGPLPQTLFFASLSDRNLGDPPFAVDASASSGLPVTFRATGSCSIAGDQVTLTDLGLCTLTASQPGDADYEPADDVSQSFDVIYAFTGFLRPVMNPPAVNRVKAGRTVPIRFRLGGDPGRDVLAEGSPAVRPVACEATAPVNDVEGLIGVRGGLLLHRPRTRSYTYLWKTDSRWAGTCQELSLELIDGSMHRAIFRFEHARPWHRGHTGKH